MKEFTRLILLHFWCSLELVLQLWPNEKGTQAPVTAFWSSSISNAVGPACGIVALKYISYPAQVGSPFSNFIWNAFPSHCLNPQYGLDLFNHAFRCYLTFPLLFTSACVCEDGGIVI